MCVSVLVDCGRLVISGHPALGVGRSRRHGGDGLDGGRPGKECLVSVSRKGAVAPRWRRLCRRQPPRAVGTNGGGLVDLGEPAVAARGSAAVCRLRWG